jgi:DNA-binding response OmpR family regulator
MARIHISDEDAASRQFLTFLLAEEGHEVSVSTAGLEALESMLVRPPDLLVLDLAMPDMDGFAVLSEIGDYQTLASMKILVLTAKGAEVDRERAFELGADAYLTKPTDERELESTVRDLLALTKEQLRLRQRDERDKARLLSQLESVVEKQGS